MGKLMDTIIGNTMENKWKMNLDFNGRANGFYNGNEWEMNFEMKMDTLMRSKFGKRFDYNELIMDNE